MEFQNINILQSTQIIFLVSNNNPAEKIINLLSANYIVKSQINEQIEFVLQKILKVNSSKDKYIFKDYSYSLPINKIIGIRENQIFLINWDNILYLYADKRDVNIFTENNLVYKGKHTLKYFEEHLPKNVFFRCHRSFLVNIEKVNEISPYFNNTFLLKFNKHKETVPVGRNYIRDFKELIGF